MKDLLLVVAAGLFSLGGVFLGALLMPLTQLYLEKKREQRCADRGKLLVAAELLHAQLILSSASVSKEWPHVEELNAFLPTSAWQENRSSLAGRVHEDLWDQLVMAYALLESDRARFALGSRSPTPIALPAKEAQGLKLFSYELGHLRRQLAPGGGWIDEIQHQYKPRIARLNDDFKKMLEGISDDELKKDAVIAEVKQRAKELGELNRDLGGDEAWLEINKEIERRLK